MTTRTRRSGLSQGPAAPELVDSGFALENADAPFLHAGLNLADIAHLLDLLRRDIVPGQAARDLLRLLLRVQKTDAEDFPYDPDFGEPYNSRERFFVEQLGDVAGWLHAGRPRREAARIALRLYVRDQLLQLVSDVVEFARETTALAGRHVGTLMPDQTYLQQAQPSTFGHYVLSFAFPAVRDARRLLDEFDALNCSPGGAGCVNGTRLLDDRSFVAAALGFDEVIEHTRDAMWQIDGLIHVLATAASLLSTQSKLAEDLEIWSSSEFDFVDLADGYTRSSILIFAYGEVPRALDLSIRVTRLMAGVVRTLQVNAERMAEELDAGYTQATDLTEFIVQACEVDYRSAYVVVGKTIREASLRGIAGKDITGTMLDEVALAETGRSWGLAGKDLTAALDARAIVESRVGTGGAASNAVESMIARCEENTNELHAAVAQRRQKLDRAELALLDQARKIVGTQEEE